MIKIYLQNHLAIRSEEITQQNVALLKKALWIDLLCPTIEEEKLVEKYLGFDIPSKKEMEEIEISSRLYKENNILYMTATMIAKSDSPELKSDAVTFILSEKNLITVRYIEPQSFALFSSTLAQYATREHYAKQLLIALLESIINRLADILESVTNELEKFSQMIFHSDPKRKRPVNYKKIMQDIGASGDLGTRVRESLISFNLLTAYMKGSLRAKLDEDENSRLEALVKDIDSLSDHCTFISTKVNFLLDATLGMVNIDQSNIIKIFSVVAVIFLPPTLIASIYGMNFRFMPELRWYFGYPIAIGLMLLSAWLPYRFFKKRKWL